MNTIFRSFLQLPENTKMVLVAIIGALIGLVTYEIIYFLNPFEPRASSSWFVAYLINIFRQHSLHRWLTFSHKGSYWKSLRRAYVMYSGSLMIGVILNWILVELLSVNHRLAWLFCLIVTASISFFFLKRYVFKHEVANTVIEVGQ